MKNFLVALLAIWCLVNGVAFAEENPRFWNGDKNYPLVWEDSQAAWYLDKNSIKVKVNDPPYFIITAQIVTTSGTETYEFFFDEEEPDMRVFDKAVADWRYLNPCELTPKEKYPMYIGEAVFYVVQGRKFYGNYLWKTETNGKINYDDEFNDKLYQNWR